jgi:peptidoglycan/LPS O-acetylase OafA/YrhL
MKPTPAQWSCLGLARFLLALVVVVAHLSLRRDDAPKWIYAGGPAFAAVAGFLMISGFSIASSLERGRKGFYGRRLLRIYPVYLLALGAWMIANPQPINAKDLVLNLLLLVPVASKPILFVAWSLGIEVAFYAIAPLLNQKRATVLACLGGIAFCAYQVTHFATVYASMEGWTPYLLLSWFWLLGYAFYGASTQAKALATVFVAFVFFSTVWATAIISATVIFALAGLALALLPSIGKWGNALGDASYPLYLVHPIILWLGFRLSLPVSVSLAIGVSFLVAWLDLKFRHALARGPKLPTVSGLTKPEVRIVGIISNNGASCADIHG